MLLVIFIRENVIIKTHDTIKVDFVKISISTPIYLLYFVALDTSTADSRKNTNANHDTNDCWNRPETIPHKIRTTDNHEVRTTISDIFMAHSFIVYLTRLG